MYVHFLAYCSESIAQTTKNIESRCTEERCLKIDLRTNCYSVSPLLGASGSQIFSRRPLKTYENLRHPCHIQNLPKKLKTFFGDQFVEIVSFG